MASDKRRHNLSSDSSVPGFLVTLHESLGVRGVQYSCENCPVNGGIIIDPEYNTRQCPFYKMDPKDRCYFQLMGNEIPPLDTVSDWGNLIKRLVQFEVTVVEPHIKLLIANGMDPSKWVRIHQDIISRVESSVRSAEKLGYIEERQEREIAYTLEEAKDIMIEAIKEDPLLLTEVMKDPRTAQLLEQLDDKPRIEALRKGEEGSPPGEVQE